MFVRALVGCFFYRNGSFHFKPPLCGFAVVHSILLSFFFFFLKKDRVLLVIQAVGCLITQLHSPLWPQTHYSPALASWMLGYICVPSHLPLYHTFSVVWDSNDPALIFVLVFCLLFPSLPLSLLFHLSSLVLEIQPRTSHMPSKQSVSHAFFKCWDHISLSGSVGFKPTL